MVDIVQSNRNKLLIRKIGYSSGLESTLDRLNILVDTYVAEHQLTAAAWKEIVDKQYRRDKSAAKHFENYFNVLGVFSVRSGRPIPQYILDVLALLKKFYSNDVEKYNSASKAIFLYSLTIADGELMAALLNSSFDAKKYPLSLTKFREAKLRIFYEKYNAKSLKRDLHRIINFEEMPDAGRKLVKGKQSIGRAPPFASTKKKELDVDVFDVSLSADWYTKVPKRRQDWCEDIGLYAGGEVTDIGHRYLSMLRDLVPESFRSKQENGKNSVIIMPLDLEMTSNHVTWLLDNELKIGFNSLVESLCNVFIGDGRRSSIVSDEVLIGKIMPFCFEAYVKADVRFARLRRELPYTILTLFCLGYCVAEGISIGNLEKVLESDERNKEIYQLRRSRNSLWGITVKGIM